MNEMSPPRPPRLGPNENWTSKFGLSTDRLDLSDTFSPQFFADEMEAVFRRSWLFVGRAERLRKPGDFFTREFEGLKKSVLITRDKSGDVRAFHNICPHRGNKLVREAGQNEVEGSCRRFFCKFHGLGFGLDGKVEVLTDKIAWLDGQGNSLQLADLPCEIWNGFIFIHLGPDGPQESLREFIGEEMWNGFDSYPFAEMTEWYSFRADANANWKTLSDGFAETYHAATVHAVPFSLGSPENYPVGASHMNDMDVRGKHRFYLAKRAAVMPFNFPYQEVTNATAIGPQYPFPKEYSTLPPAANPVGLEYWGNSTIMFWPNFFLQFYAPGWFLTYRMIPIGPNRMRFETDMYLPAPRNFSEALAQKSCMLQFLEAALQDFGMLEGQQQGLETQAFASYPLTDQEVLLRQFHTQIQDAVQEYRAEQAA